MNEPNSLSDKLIDVAGLKVGTDAPATRLFGELRQAAIDWLQSVGVASADNPLLLDSTERLRRIGHEIKALKHDEPGALRAKAANSFFWFEDADEIARDIRSRYSDVSARADLTLASAMALCPDFVEVIEPLRRAHSGTAEQQL